MRSPTSEPRDGHGPATASSGGFSLVEILITLAILGLMMGMLVVNMGGLTRTERLRAGARKLAGMSDLVRSVATGTQRSCFLEIDLDSHQYRVRQNPPLDRYGRAIDPDDQHLLSIEELDEWEEGSPWDDLPQGVYFKSVFISKQLHWKEGQVKIEYLPTGGLQSTIIHLQTAKGESSKDKPEVYSVLINGLSGKSEVFDWEHHFTEADESDFSAVMGDDAPGGRDR